jgi:deoxycytidylate deaminase
MEKAALMAMQSPMKFKHGAVLVKFGRTIGSGFNYDRARFRGKDITSVHAEIEALDGKTLATASGADIYVARLSETGWADSKPCNDCLETLKRFKISKVYYTTREHGIVSEKVKDMDGYAQLYRPSSLTERNIIKPTPP